jgi:hypothetical protein
VIGCVCVGVCGWVCVGGWVGVVRARERLCVCARASVHVYRI